MSKRTKAQHQEDTEELRTWCRENGVDFRALYEPEIERPEKDWHVIVYGGGRAALNSIQAERRAGKGHTDHQAPVGSRRASLSAKSNLETRDGKNALRTSTAVKGQTSVEGDA